MKIFKFKRLYKFFCTIENIIAGILGLIGVILMCSITHTWAIFFITKTIGITLILFAYWELVDEE